MNESPQSTVGRLAEQLAPVGREQVALEECVGRILAAEIIADRDSPACDASAMDGYSVRACDVGAGALPVCGEARIGRAPPAQEPGTAVRIVTGAPLPAGADAVIRREDVEEHGDRIVLRRGEAVAPGQDVRRRGENILAGQVLLRAGVQITPAVAAALASVGTARPPVYRRVRVAVIVSGDEVVDIGQPVSPWQLRDANGASLRAMLRACPWVEVVSFCRVGDELGATTDAIRRALDAADAVLLSGGVSAGDRDYVPDAVRRAGAEVVFHGLPIRPGKPMLGAVAGGRPLIGLPGNPVSVMVTACRLGAIVLRRLAGFADAEVPATPVEVDEPEMVNQRLWLYRPVKVSATGAAHVLHTRGSGDFVSAARSDGFVEVPAGAPPQKVRRFYRWSI